jgi:hypothetical protein
MFFWPFWHFWPTFLLKTEKSKRKKMQRHEGYCKNKKSCTKINIEQDAKRNQMGIIMHNQIENEKHICIKQTRTQCFRKKIG